MKILKKIQALSSLSLARDSVIVFAGSMIANVFSYVYHLLMGRFLGPSGYGELSSLLSLLYIFTVPLLVGQTVIIKYISGFKAHGEIGQSKSLFLRVTKWCIVCSLIGIPLVVAVAPWVTTFLHLSSNSSWFMMYTLLVFSLLIAVAPSILQGYQWFIWYSALTAGAVCIKVMLSIPFVQWWVFGVLSSATLSSAFLYVLYIFPFIPILKAKSTPSQLTKQDTFAFTVPTFLTILGVTSFYSTDIILVRHYFNTNEAGLYAALAILGKIIFYASSSVSLVLFPVLSEQTAKGRRPKKLITAGILGVLAVSTVLTLVYFLFPATVIGLLFGQAYKDAGTLLGMFGVFLTIYSVGNVISMASLAIGKTSVWVYAIVCAFLQICSIILFHRTITAVISINIIVCALYTVGVFGYYRFTYHEKV